MTGKFCCCNCCYCGPKVKAAALLAAVAAVETLIAMALLVGGVNNASYGILR